VWVMSQSRRTGGRVGGGGCVGTVGALVVLGVVGNVVRGLLLLRLVRLWMLLRLMMLLLLLRLLLLLLLRRRRRRLLLRWWRTGNLLEVGRRMGWRRLRVVGVLGRGVVSLGWRLGGRRLVGGVGMVLRAVVGVLGMRGMLGMLLLGMLLWVEDARSRMVGGMVVWRRQALGGVGVMLAQHVG